MSAHDCLPAGNDWKGNALEESELRYRLLVENLAEGVAMAREGKLIFVNPAFARIFRHEPEDLVGRGVESLVAPEQRPFVAEQLRRWLAGEPAPPCETVGLRSDGQSVPLEVFGCAVKHEGKPAVQLTVRDLSAPKRKEALPQSGEELRVLTDALPVLITYVDSGLRYRFNNRAYEDWFGVARSELYGKHVEEVIGASACEALRPYIERALSGEAVTFDAVVPYKDGGTRYVHSNYVPRIGSQGEVEGFFALVTDLTERKTAEEEILDLTERKLTARTRRNRHRWERRHHLQPLRPRIEGAGHAPQGAGPPEKRGSHGAGEPEETAEASGHQVSNTEDTGDSSSPQRRFGPEYSIRSRRSLSITL